MANLIEAKLDLPAGAYAPDPYDQGDGVVLRLDAVISRDQNGAPLSLVGDFVWNLKFYTPRRQTSYLSFYFWKKGRETIAEEEITASRVALIRELQYLMVLRIYRSEQTLGYNSLASCLLCLAKMARFAHQRRCSLKDVLERTAILDEYIVKSPAIEASSIISLLNFLRKRDPVNELGFNLARAKTWRELTNRAKKYAASLLQTAPLPTRIYAGVINALAKELDEFEAKQGQILAALREGLVLTRQYKESGGRMGAQLGQDLMERHDLIEFLARKGCRANLQGLTTAITEIMRICKTQTHVFSGMRSEEAEHLPYHCMESVKAGHGRLHCLILGVTTKLVGARRKRTRWVTTDAQGFRAIRLAQSLADVIYEFAGVKPSTADDAKDDFPLFVSSAYLPWISNTEVPANNQFSPSRSLYLSDTLKAAICPIIEPKDIEELEAIDPFRDWRGEAEFAIGNRWNLKSHQLRRSLALYANASGLVMSSSLKRQLQHITREMTEYYGRGSVFAKNFLADDVVEYRKHICVEWQDSEQEAQYLAFTNEVLNSIEPLCGPGGLFYDLKKQRGEVMSPEEIRDQIRMGRLSYKAHPLGGCTHIGACDKQKGLRLTSGICISENCRSLIGKHSRILKIIPIQRGIVANLDPNSIVYQMEKEELGILEAAEVNWQSSNRPLTGLPGGTHV